MPLFFMAKGTRAAMEAKPRKGNLGPISCEIVAHGCSRDKGCIVVPLLPCHEEWKIATIFSE